MKRILFSFLCVLMSLSTLAGQVIVKNGKAKARIVKANNNAQTDTAAVLLQYFVQRISGAKLAIVDDNAKKGDIIIGGTAGNCAGEDGYQLITKNDCLYINSGGDKGAVHGVVALLENYLGVNYYAYNFYTLTESANIELPNINKSSTPAFRYRQTFSYGNEDPVYKKWFALEDPADEFIDNMWVHTFNRILPAKRFGKTHPEYYSFLNGKRRPGEHSQWCLSNPYVLQACITQLDSIFKANPNMSMISVSQNDGNDTYCHCHECMKIYEEEGAVSGAYIRFMNKLAERFPDKQISTLAYLFTCQPPKKVKPLPNVNIMLCNIDCKREVPLTDNASGQWFVQAMEGWAAISNNLFVWDYGINFDNTVSPFPNFHILQPNIQLFHKNNTKMHFSQVNGIKGGDFSEMRAYMLAKLMWNPYQDADSLMQTFMKGYYGKAAPYLYQYQKIMQGALLASHKELWIYDSPITHKDGMLSKQLLKTYDELFDKAEEAVKDDTRRLANVQLSRLTLQYSKLEFARTEGISDTEQIAADLNLFEKRIKKFGVETLNERNNRPEEYCGIYRKRFLPQVEKSKALGAKVTFLDIEGETAAGAHAISPKGAPDTRYQAIADKALTDGLYGGTTYVESWVGWCGRDANFIIDLGKEVDINRIESDFLHQLGAWILLPKGVVYDVSLDNKTWKTFGTVDFQEDRDLKVKFVVAKAEASTPVKARYVKVNIKTLGLCPDWHYGVGYPAWFFLDEVNIY